MCRDCEAMQYNVGMRTRFGQALTKAQTTEKVARFYDLGSAYYMTVWGQHIHDGYYATGKESPEDAQIALVRTLAAEARIGPHDSVLDVGCGVGGSSIWLAQNKGAHTLGITISPAQARIANDLANRGEVDCSFLMMDAEALAFKHSIAVFDVIWAVAVMTHLKDQERFVQNAFGLLKRGGRFVIFDWMLGPNSTGEEGEPTIEEVSEGMLLSTLYGLRSYEEWFSKLGASVTYARDITDNTIETWDAARGITTNPRVWMLALGSTAEEREVLSPFFRCIGPMKKAMQGGKLISGAIVAEKP